MLPKVLRCTFVLSIIFLAEAQEFLNFPPLAYQQGSPYYQQHQPNYPPHFRPFGYHHHHHQAFSSPTYKPLPYHSLFSQPESSPYQNDLRHPLGNLFIPGYNSFYQQYPQYDESYPDIDEYNKVQPTLREPIQLIPSRFPQRVENVVEKIQNRFSIYNPNLIPNVPILIEISANETDIQPTPIEVTPVEQATIANEVSATPSGNLISSTEATASESATDASEDVTVRQNVDGEDAEDSSSPATLEPEESTESSTEGKVEENSTETGTEAEVIVK